MLAHQLSQPPRASIGLIAPPEQYCAIPQRLLCDLHDTPVAIGIYALVARLFLIEQRPVPLSRADVQRYDPSLKVGAVKRALDRLVDCGWLVAATPDGQRKQRYTPTWGRIKGAPLPWRMDTPCLGRPRHIVRLLLDRSLLDVCMGRIIPHATQAATITRYVTAPALGLADIGSYALALAGMPRETAGLLRLGLVRAGQAQAVPLQARLLALISQRALLEQAGQDLALTTSGTRKLGVGAAPEKAERGQPLFFVPPGLIGNLIGGLIGTSIGSAGVSEDVISASESAKTREKMPPAGITWDSGNQANQATPPPNPPAQISTGGGGDRSATKRKPKERASRSAEAQPAEAKPESEAIQLLKTINVLPEQIDELSSLSAETILLAIRDGQARPGVRDLAGWVVKLLRTHRDHGWTIAPPAESRRSEGPRAERPEDLRMAFARYAAAQEAERRAGLPEDAPWFAPEPARLNLPDALPKLWNELQAALKAQLPRAEFSLIRHATLQSVERGVATIQAPNQTVKAALEDRHLSMLRDLIGLHVGEAIEVRVALNPHAPTPRPAPVAQPAETEGRPSWIAAERWAELPALLRAALVGAELVDGAVRGRDAFVSRLLETRHRREVEGLVAARSTWPCS